MSYIYRVPLTVKDFNPLAGGFTNGVSMMSIFGLCTALERKSGIVIDGFMVTITEHLDKTNLHLKQSMDQQVRDAQRESPSFTENRHSDLKGALYFISEDYANTAELADIVMSLRVQGGAIMNYIEDKDISVIDLNEQFEQNAAALQFIREHERTKLAQLYKKTSLSYSSLTCADIAKMLVVKHNESPEYVPMCTGFAAHGVAQLPSGGPLKVVEPVLTLVSPLRVYQLKEETFCIDDYFFSFNTAEHNRDPRLMMLQ